ncbi:hypothetical protein BJY52DRAFT_1213222 [Lactarius psammicola]|nr:hypothetical protein BJY52DRAFT_1213222 [Lactarius psammicola]
MKSPSYSASEDDPSDTNADESESQGLAVFARAPSSMEQAHEVEADAKNPRITRKKSSSGTSSGTDLDLSIIVALIEPLVNWLTGSDHIKGLFLVLFLIVYLHQLVQVPWELYNASRKRRSHPSFRSLNLQENEEAVIKIQTKRAATELRRQEFAYLFLSMVTPFAGAHNAFVLAAGVRPWSHLTSRLREHTSSLQDSIHYPSPDTQFIVDSRLQVVVNRINGLEQELSTVKRAMAMRAYVDDMHEELNSALQDTERTIRKQERRVESTRNSYDTRLAMLEKAISGIERTHGGRVRGTILSDTSSTSGHPYKSLEFVVDTILHFLRELANSLTLGPPSTQASPKTPPAFMVPGPSLHHAKPPNWPQLGTIKEDAMEQPNTDRRDEHSSLGQSDNEAPLTSCQSDLDDVGVSRSHRQSPLNMTNVIANVVSLPYRLAVGIIVAVFPPLQHFFY